MVKEVVLENFKCFKQEKISLSAVTILSGINGMGKSTVIQAFLLLRQTFEQKLINKGLALNGELVSIGTGKDLLYKYAEEPEIIKLKLDLENNTQLEWNFDYDSKSDFLKKIVNDDEHIDESLGCISLFNDKFEYICAERIGPRNIYPKSYYTVKEKNQLGSMGQYTEHYLLVNGDRKISNEKAKYQNVNDLSLLYQVQGWLNEISPGMNIVAEDYVNADSVGLRYRTSENIPNEFSPNNVGFGITYVLPVIVALIKASPGDLVIIENPEAHLHPKGQRMMGELIAKVASGGVQVIVETHSDHILNGIRLSVRKKFISKEEVALHYFEKELKEGKYIHKIVSPNVKADGRLTFWPDGFFDEWDKALDELF